MAPASLALLLFGASHAAGQSTGCVDICPGYPGVTRCVVSQNVTVVDGSIIDCGDRDVEVTGGNLTVSDGTFVLKAASLLVQRSAGGTNHSIVANCPQASGRQGFRVSVTGGVTVGVGGTLNATCSAQGGTITLEAGGAVSVGGFGIQANGTSANAAGGAIAITAGGAVTTTADIQGTTTSANGSAAGGSVELAGTSITVGGQVNVHGVGPAGGGSVGLDASGDITITSANALVDATVDGGFGGSIQARAGGTLQVSRPLRGQGIGSTTRGGFIGLTAATLNVNNDVLATGGVTGGSIWLESIRGGLEIGTWTGNQFNVDAGTTSNNGGQAGTVTIISRGNDVVIGAPARVYAKVPGGKGGAIDVRGVNVTTSSGSQVIADGASGQGGGIGFIAEETMSLQGTVRSNNGEIDMIYRSTLPSVGGGVSCPCVQLQDTSLPPRCGDGWTALGVEPCDPGDLNGETCQSQGHGAGDLDCNADCTFNYSGCG